MRKVIRCGLFILATYGLAGCTVYNSDHQTQYADAEGRVPQQLFSRLEQQAASKPWLLKQLGQPQAITQVAHGAQVYTWALTRREISEHSVLLLYKSQHSKTQQSYLHIVFGGDELLKHWLDRDAQVDTTALLGSRDMQHLALNKLERTSGSVAAKNTPAKSAAGQNAQDYNSQAQNLRAYTPEISPVVTHITPADTDDISE